MPGRGSFSPVATFKLVQVTSACITLSDSSRSTCLRTHTTNYECSSTKLGLLASRSGH